jgi:hypothetical protein
MSTTRNQPPGMEDPATGSASLRMSRNAGRGSPEKAAAAVIAALLEHDEATPRGRPRLTREASAFLRGAAWALESVGEGKARPAVAKAK